MGKPNYTRVALVAAALLLTCRVAVAQPADVSYSDDFQSYGSPRNPAGWIDTSVGNPRPQASGLYKTWPDPIQGNQGTNIVYGTKQSSGKPEGSNPRIGTFSTYTSKTFTASGRFEYRGRLIRTNADSRIGLTVLSSYPEQDKYYLLGLWSVPNSADLTMQLFGFGAGALTGTTNSNASLAPNKWYRFLIQVDDVDDVTKIRARFWLDGTAEPTTFSIDASDAGAARLKSGRIGMWAADKGAAYIDDISAKSPVDHSSPTISFFENNIALQPNTLTRIDHDARVDVRAADDLSGIASLAVTVDGAPYTPLAPITAEGSHTIIATAVDRVGNATTSQTQILIDKTPPIVQLTESGVPLALPIARFKRPPAVDIAVSDAWTGATYIATLDGQPYATHTPITVEGTHHLTVDAVDGVGHHTIVQATILVDLGAPLIEFYESGVKLTSPAKFRVDPAIELRLTDAHSNATYTATLENGQPWRSLDPIPTGAHKITVNAVDEAGNTASATLDVLVDKDAPVVILKESGITLDPALKSKYRRDVAIEISVADATSSAQWNATLNGQPYTSGTLITAEQNAHALKVHAADDAGNVTDVTLSLLLDKSVPVIAFEESGIRLDPRELHEFARDAAVAIDVTDVVSTATYTATLVTPARGTTASYTSGTPISVEDTHEISVTAVDEAGNTSEAKLTILVDKTAPTVAFSEAGAPLDTMKQTPFARDAHVDISVSDNLPGVTYTAKLDGADYTSGAAITTDGPHVVSVVATDRASNATNAEVRVLVDKTGPVIEFFEGNVPLDPTKRQDFRRLPSIEIRVTDALSAVTSTVTIDGTPYSSMTPVAEGFHAIVVRATDALGNASEAKLDLLVDTTAPVVKLRENGTDLPATGAIFARDVKVDAVIQDISDTTTAAILDGAPFSLSLPISAEGQHALQFTVTDELAWTTTVGATFTIDKTAPKISVFEGTTPLLGGASFARDVIINATAEDITAVQLTATIDGAPYTFGTTYSTNGTHTIVVNGVDAAGNHSQPLSIVFHLDKNAPEVTLEESGAAFPVGKTFTRDIVASVSIVAATQTTTVATIDGQPYTLESPFAPEGRHRIEVKVTNLAGLATTVGADFTIDKTPPTLALFAKEGTPFVEGLKFAADITPFTTADDNLTKPPRVVVLLDGQQLPPNTLVSEEKFHTISATATDDGGLSTSVGPFGFVLDKTAPSVEVNVDGEPLEDGQKFNKIITPTITADDLTATTITVRLNDAPYAIGTAIEADGVHTLVIRVQDDLGNETLLDPIHFTIDKTAPIVRILDSLDNQPFIGGKFKRPVKPIVEINDLTETLTNATINDKPWTSGQEISSDGHYTLKVTVTDELGWITTVPPIELTIDQTAPVVSITESGEALVTGTIFNRDARPKIEVTDTTRATVEATLNGAPYVAETPITEERKHTLIVKATDELGFVTQVPPIELTVDKTAPIVTVTENGAPFVDNALLNHDARPIVSVVELTSFMIDAKVDGSPYVLGTPVTAEGPHTFDVKVTDAAGWVTTLPTIRFTVDKTAPVVTITESGVPLASGAEFDRTITPIINVQDISATTVVAKLNGVAWTSGTAIAAEGKYVLEVSVTDAAQWTTNVPPIAFTIDKSAPIVRVVEAGVVFETGKKYKRAVQPTIEIEDLTATTTVATLNGQPWTSGTPIAQDGRHVLAITVTDHLNHVTTVPPIEFIIDQTAPVVTVTESAQPFTGGAFNRNLKPEIAISDLTSTTTVALLNGAPYTFGTEVTAEGQYTLTATVTDELGWSTSIPVIVFFIDRTAPVVKLMEGEKELTNGLFFNRDVSPRAIITDTTTTATTATLNGQPYTLETPIAAEGAYTLAVKVTDAVGLVTDVPPVSFTIDKTAPSISFTSPAANAIVATPQVVVVGQADDAVSVEVNGIEATIHAAEKEFVTPVAIELLEGENTLTALGIDRAGNNTTITIIVNLDTRAPELAVTSPKANACIDATELQVAGTAGDASLQSVKVSIGGASTDATLSADRRSFTATVPAPNEGKFVLRVEARDGSGHVSTATVPVTIDRTKPIVEVTEGGRPFAATLVNRPLALFVRAKDSDPAASVVAKLDGQPYASGTAIMAEGPHELRAIATDCANHVSDEVVLPFIIDRTPPSILSITPANGATIGQKPGITGVLSEPAGVVDERSGLSALVSGTTFAFGDLLEEGINNLSFLLTDAAGNQARVAYSVTVDTTAPTVEITESGLPIAADAVFARPVTPIIQSSDSGAAITATKNGQPFASGTTISDDGEYTITAKARDAQGNESATATARFRIDRSAPTIALTAPAADAIIDGETVEVRGTVAGNDIASVIVNGASATLTDNAFAVTIALELGPNVITAVATDRSGNSVSTTRAVTRSRGELAIILTSPVDKMLTNRPTIVVAGQVVTPSAAQTLTINGATVPFDAAGVFRRNDFPLNEGENDITATVSHATGAPNSVRVTVTADFTAPLLEVHANGTALSDGARFATSPSITFQTSESATTTLTVDGEIVAPGVTTLANGGHALTAIARDAAGNESRVDRVFFVGDAANAAGCALGNIEPATNSTVFSEIIRITGRSGGAAGVLINGIAASVAEGSFCGEATLAPGRNEVTIRCADASGQPTSDAPVVLVIERYLDPAIAITSPTPGLVLTTNKVTVSGTVGAGVTSGDVNGIPFTIPNDGAPTHTFSVPDVPVTAGLNVLVARAKTSSQRMSATSVRVRVATAAPQVAITSPLTGSETGAQTIDVSGTWTHADPSTISVKVGSASYPVTVISHSDTSGTFVAGAVQLAPGALTTIAATARNAAGVQASLSIEVRHAATLPSIQITSPADNTYFASTHGGTIQVTGTFNADAGSQVQVNGANATTTGSSFTADVDIAASASGITPIIARVITPDGRQATDSVRAIRLLAPLAVEQSFPAADSSGVEVGAAIVVLFTNPIDRSTVSAFRVTDASGANVDGEVLADRDAVTFAPAQPLRFGQRYTVNVATTLKDLAGAPIAAAHSFSFVVVGTAPSNAPVVDETPTSGCFNGTTITGRASGPAARVRLDVDGVTMSTIANESGAFKFTISFSGQSGYHLVRVREVGTDGTLSAERALCFRITCAVPQVMAATLDRAAKKMTIQFSKAMNAASVDAAILLEPSLARAVSLAGDTATVTLTSIPDEAITLTVKKSATDASGTPMAADFTQTFAFNTDPTAGRGDGYVTGAVYDATNGRPLESAVVEILGVTIRTTDKRGRYSHPMPEGAYTIQASAPGYTTVWRQVVVPAGAGVVPIDIRLTRRGPENTSLTLTHGADTKITKKVELHLSAGSLPSNKRVRLTSVGAQSLAGLLPLGWSPLASAEVVIDDNSDDLPGAKLTFFVDASAVVAANQTLSLGQYDSERDEWRAIVAVANVGSDGRVAFDIDSAGNYALVYPDKGSTLVARVGSPLPSAANPCIVTPDVCRVTSRSFVLDPKAVLPSGRTVATLTTDGAKPYPSGTAVQAFIDEQLNLADGRVLIDPPFATDLLIYRTLAGDTGVADFHLSPSAQAMGVILRDGVDHIRVVDYPNRIDRGTLIGAEGGRVPGDGTVTIDIPAGATAEPLHASVTPLDVAAFNVAGFRVVAGFTLALTRTSEPQLPEGASPPPVELLTPARASIPTLSGQVVIGEVLSSTPFGTMVRLAALTANGSTRAINSTQLPLDGIVRAGAYLVLVADAPIAYAYGQVRSAGGLAIAEARVTASNLGVRDITRIDGRFVIPVPSKPASPFTLVPRTVATGDGTAYVAPTSPDADAFVNVGVLTFAAQAPRLVSVTPADGTQVDAGAIAVQATFDVSIDGGSLAGAIQLKDLTRNANVVGVVALNGATVIRFTPAEPLRPGTSYAITIAPTIRSASGAAFSRTATSQFTTRAGNAVVNRDRITITIPDANGKSTIAGRAGALPGGANLIAVRRGRFFIESYTATVASDGSFSFDAGHRHASDRISLEDTIDLEVLDAVSRAVVAIIELTPFSSGDGRAFVARPDRVSSFLSADGIRVTVPAGAFDEPTLINVAPSAKAAFSGVPKFDNELGYATSVELTFEGVSRKPLALEMPVPAGLSPAGRDWLLGYLGQSVRGPRVMIVDTVRVEGGMFKNGPATAALGARRVASNATLIGEDLQKYLAMVRRSGIYATVDLSVPGAGLAAGFIQGLQGAFDMFWNTLESLYAAHFYVADNDGRIVIPVVKGKPFTIVGVDAATGIEAFSKVYDPIPENDPGTTFTLPNPHLDRIGPYPTFGTPFRIESVDVNVEDVEIRSLRDFTIKLRSGIISVETTLPDDVSVAVLNAANGSIDRSRSGGLSVSGAIGDRLVVLVEQNDVDPFTALSVVFSEPIALPTTDEEIAVYLQSVVGVEIRSASGEFTPITGALRLTADSGGRRVLIETPASLNRGSDYRVVLSPTIADKSGLRMGQVRSPDGTESAPLSEPLYLQFHVRTPGGLRASFDLESGVVRDQALNGNVLLMTALEGGVVAYDVADPAGMKTDTRPIGRVRGDVTSYWGIASDHHGRVYATGLGALFGVLHSFRLEDFLPTAGSTATREVPVRAAAQISFAPGASANLAIDSRVIATDRPEAIPRKLQILLQDDDQSFDSREDFKLVTDATVTSASGELEVLTVDIARAADFAYAVQRITVENVTLDMRWSGDATTSAPARIAGIVARPNDRLRIIRNLATYGVVSLFGYGVGVFDLNAMESNDWPTRPEGFTEIREKVRLTDGKQPGICDALALDAIPDLTFTPDAMILPRPDSADFSVFALDAMRGVLDLNITPPTGGIANNIRCDVRSPLGLRFHNRYFLPNGDVGIYDDPRLVKLRELFTAKAGREPNARYTGTAPYRWTLESKDNRGARGSVPGTRVVRDYMLVPGNEYGLIVVEVDGNPRPASMPPYSPLAPPHIVDVIWIPNGAAAVRTIPRTNLATVVDGKGHVLLVDLSRIDERWDENGKIADDQLFATATKVLGSGIDTPDPRIVWRSSTPLVSGTLAPVVDTDTGFVYAGKLLEKTTNVVSAIDPRLQIKVDVGAAGGLSEVGGIVPLGVDPPKNITLTGENASLAAFRVELAMPGGGDEIDLRLESEIVRGAKALDTPSGWPRAHLNVPMKRAVPPNMAELRYQRGFNKWHSPWIVSVADVRASEKWQWPSGTTAEQKAIDGCAKCERPAALKNKPEPEAFELYTTGRLIAVRPDFADSSYSFLNDRLATRITAVPADTVRPREAQIAAHNPPVAGGALQETTYVHSGEIETSNIDLDAGGRAGLNVLADRTYLSRTIGGTAFGAGWDSLLFRRLRPLPNGNVEYRDGTGEMWLFTSRPSGYESPRGLFLQLSRTSDGWTLVDQQRRETRFDSMGRLVAETDHLYDNKGGGNITRYLYDASGRLALAIDPVNRETSFKYNAEGLVEEIRDWRGRKVNYAYNNGRLAQVSLPEAKAAEGVPAEFNHVGANRPRIVYAYDDAAGGPTLNDTVELKTNLKSIKDPAEVTHGGAHRVTFAYTGDRVREQTWATGERAAFTFGDASATVVDALNQSRTYSLTSSDAHDKRVHIREVKTEAVPILQYAEANLPAAATPNLAAEAQTLTTSMTYRDDGQLESVTNPNLLRVISTYESARNGAAGSILVKTTESGPAFAGSETEYIYEPTTNLVAKIARTEGGSRKERATPHPTRENKKTVVSDEQVSTISMYQADGQLASVSNAVEGTETAVIRAETRYFPATASSPIERSRPQQLVRGLGGSETETQSLTYRLLADGGEHIESRDEVRGTNVVTITDAVGRTVAQTVTGSDGAVLADERFGYAASGLLAYHTRTQRELGVVETRTKYDAVGREVETSMTGAAVEGLSSIVKTTTSYDLAARKVTRTDPTSGSSVPAEEVTTLDGLGRSIEILRRGPTAQTVAQKYAYDASGERSFESDSVRAAVLYHHDLLGRTRTVVRSDGTKTDLTYTPWSEIESVTERRADGAMSAASMSFYTKEGRLKSANESTGAGARKRQYSWLEGGRRTIMRVGEVPTLGIELLASGTHRAEQTLLDSAGHLVEERIREVGATFDPASTDGVFAMTTRSFVGGVPTSVRVKEPLVGAEYETTLRHDGLGRLVEEVQAGTFTTKTEYDEASNVVFIARPGMAAETASYDSRGLVTRRTLADGKTNLYRYDALGNLRELVDEAGESTFYDYDPFGRLTKIRYADSTFEETRYEDKTGAIEATRDRAGQWLAHSYDNAGRVAGVHFGETANPNALLVKREHDSAGRLRLVRNKDAGIEYDEYDHLGRPGLTRTYRYRGGSGLQSTPDVLDVHVQRHTWSIHDERATWRLPAAGAAVPASDNLSSPWLQTIVETRDGGSNLIAQQKAAGGDLVSARPRSTGRLLNRRQILPSGSAITTSYGFADGIKPDDSLELPPVVSTTGPPTGLPLWTETSVGSARVAGSANIRDAALRLKSQHDLATERLSGWDYDRRGRLTDVWLGLVPTETEVGASATDTLVDSDFRAERRTESKLTPSQHARLGSEAAKIEPFSWTATRTSAHQLNTRTLTLDEIVQATRDYAFSGGRRTSDGVWSYAFDELGRLTSATSTDRRIDLTWDPNGRLVGRAAYEKDGSGWKLETRNAILTRDGLPAETTFVWDSIVDRLVAIYRQAASTQAGAGPDAGLLRQYFHGDQGYDDPTRVLVAQGSGTPATYFPIIDEAGTGSLAAILDENGNLVERVLYADAYGDAPRYLQGPVADKISLQLAKDGGGNLSEVKVRVHLSERIDASTLATGARLVSVKVDKTLAQLSSAVPALEDDFTIVWSLSTAEWNALTAAANATAIEISLTNALRAEGWGSTPVAAVPNWARMLYGGADATAAQPVIYRESLASISSFASTIASNGSESRPLYEIRSLYLAAVEESKAKLLTGFQALPFREPATGLVYARGRWYDASTGSFLTPDPVGYRDSSNLYTFCGADPVNCSDPTGEFGVRDVRMAIGQVYTDIATHAVVTGQAITGIARSVGNTVVGTAATANLIYEASKPGNVQAQLQLVGGVVATRDAVAEWGTSAGYAIVEPELIGQALNELTPGEFAGEVFDAAIMTAGFVVPAAKAKVPVVRAPSLAARRSSKVRARFDASKLSAGQVDTAILKSIRRKSGASGTSTGQIAATADQTQYILQKTTAWRRNVHAANQNLSSLPANVKGTLLHSSVQSRISQLNISGLTVNQRLYGTSQFMSPNTGLPYAYRVPDFRSLTTIFDIKPFGAPLSGPQYIDFQRFSGLSDIRWIYYAPY